MIPTLHWGKRYCIDLYRESLYGIYEMQLVRKVVTQKVLDIVSRKVSDLCFRKKLSTVLRKTGKDDLMKFSLEQLCGSVLLKQRNGEMSATYRLIYVLGIVFK
jgi:hypothetical protein